jgi:hypothetical protein
MLAWRDSAVSASRIMTPALDHAFTLLSDATRATTSALPVIGWYTN